MQLAGAPEGATTGELVAAVQRRGPDAPSAFECLLSQNEPLLHRLVAKSWPSGPDDEDLLQMARMAFADAVDRFRPGRDATFTSFAWSVVRGRVIDEVRRRNREARALPRVDGLGEGEPDTEALERHLRLLVLRAALAAMPRDDRNLLARLYEREESQTEVARDLGVSHTAVHKRQRRILSRLRYALSA